VKAFILAAGVGNRLKPLTYHLPKPMVPILNKPALWHIISNMQASGITDIMLNLHYRPDVIKNYFGSSFKNVELSYSIEKKLLGTAGAIKKNESFFDNTFIVMSGDGLSGINLKKLVNFHKKKKALATVVLKKVDACFDYGVGITCSQGRITKFVEKPSWESVFSNTVNTGIYVFEPEIFNYIPKNKFHDFGANLLPLLLRKNLPVYGYEMGDYWTDIGNLKEYKEGICAALGKKVKTQIDGVQIKRGVWAHKTSRISPAARIKAPCIIGENCTIESGVTIKPYCVIGNNVTVKKGAVLTKTTVWDGAVIGEKTHLENSIIGYNEVVAGGIRLFDSVMMSNR